jgi:hypothetical protein
MNSFITKRSVRASRTGLGGAEHDSRKNCERQIVQQMVSVFFFFFQNSAMLRDNSIALLGSI